MNESQWRRDVLRLAQSSGWRYWYTYYSPYSTPGWPDLALAKPPVLILTELKGERGKYRAGQEATADVLERCERVEYHLWRPKHEPEVIAALGITGRLL